MVGHVVFEDGVVGLVSQLGQDSRATGAGVGGDVGVVHIAGGGGEEEHDRVGAGKGDLAIGHGHGPAADARLELGLEGELARRAGAAFLGDAAGESEGVVAQAGGLPLTVGAGEGRGKVKLAGRVTGDADGDHLVGVAGDDLAGEGGIAHLVLHAGRGRVEIELAAVVARGTMGGEGERQVAEGLVVLLPQRHAHAVLAGQALGLALLALEEKLPHLGQRVGGAEVLVVLRLAGPQAVFIELEPLDGHAAEDRGAHTAVADHERLLPLLGGPAVPQHPAALRRRGLAGELGVGRAHRVGGGLLEILCHFLSFRTVGVDGPAGPGQVVAFANLPRAGQPQRALGARERVALAHDASAAALVVDPHGDQVPRPGPHELGGHGVAALGARLAIVLRRHRAGGAHAGAVEERLVGVVDAAQVEPQRLPLPGLGHAHEAAVPREAIVAAQLRHALPEARHAHGHPLRGRSQRHKQQHSERRNDPTKHEARHGMSPLVQYGRMMAA